MAKIRDYDAELKALGERAKQLKARKVQQYGELVEATGADALDPDLLAGALLAATLSTDKAAQEAWRQRGADFFRARTRQRASRARGGGAGGTAAAAGREPDRGGKGAP